MDTANREHLRLSLLRHLATNPTRFGLTAPLLMQYIRAEGMSVERPEIESELLYLVDKGLAVQVDKTISPENAAYRVSALGRDLHAQRHGG